MSKTKVSIMEIFWTLGTVKQGENTEKRKWGVKGLSQVGKLHKNAFEKTKNNSIILMTSSSLMFQPTTVDTIKATRPNPILRKTSSQTLLGEEKK